MKILAVLAMVPAAVIVGWLVMGTVQIPYGLPTATTLEAVRCTFGWAIIIIASTLLAIRGGHTLGWW